MGDDIDVSGLGVGASLESALPYISGVLVLAVVAFFVSRLLSTAPEWGGATRPADSQLAELCRKSVKERLKAPATARFGTLSVSRPGDTYRVTGHVDSENSFGADIRTDIQCDIARKGEQITVTDVTLRQR